MFYRVSLYLLAIYRLKMTSSDNLVIENDLKCLTMLVVDVVLLAMYLKVFKK